MLSMHDNSINLAKLRGAFCPFAQVESIFASGSVEVRPGESALGSVEGRPGECRG